MGSQNIGWMSPVLKSYCRSLENFSNQVSYLKLNMSDVSLSNETRNPTDNVKSNVFIFSQSALISWVGYRVSEKEKLVDHEGEEWPSMPCIWRLLSSWMWRHFVWGKFTCLSEQPAALETWRNVSRIETNLRRVTSQKSEDFKQFVRDTEVFGSCAFCAK